MKKFILLILTAIISFGYINESRAVDSYVYDEKGRLIRAPGSGGDFSFEYDEDDNLIKKGNELTYYTYSYENGNKTKAEQYWCSSGKCTKYTEYRYTYTDGNMTKEERYDKCSSGTCKSSEDVYTYTGGNMTKDEHYDCSSGKCRKYSEDVYTYTDGNMTKKEHYWPCSSGTCPKYGEEAYTYEFDKYGNIIKRYHDGYLEESHEYPDEYYVSCSNSKSCIACSKWSNLKNGVCNPNWEWEFDEDSKTLYIDENMPNFTTDFLGLSTMTIDKIVCRGDVEKCRKVMAKYPLYYPGGSYGADPYGYSSPIGGGYKPTDLSEYVEPASETNCESERYYWSGSSCNNKSGGINCEENFKQIETWCNRIRYTPAEAAEVLHDGSDNEIIMTFKVNR